MVCDIPSLVSSHFQKISLAVQPLLPDQEYNICNVMTETLTLGPSCNTTPRIGGKRTQGGGLRLLQFLRQRRSGCVTRDKLDIEVFKEYERGALFRVYVVGQEHRGHYLQVRPRWSYNDRD